MPIYEYKCTECEHTLEKLQKMSEDALVDCPECGKPSLKKMISAAGFRLKGAGWYETDFKSGNKKNVAESGGSSSPAGTSPATSTSPAASTSSSGSGSSGSRPASSD